MNRRIVFSLFAVVLFAVVPLSSFAQNEPAMPAGSGGPVAAGQAQAEVNPNGGKVSIVVAPPVADTTVSIGTLGAELLGWVGVVFIPVIGGFLTKLVMSMAQRAGLQVTQAMSDKLDSIIENGLHSGQAAVQNDLTGKLNVDVKSRAVADAVAYAQTHGAETIKSLTGSDPNDPKVVEALQARATKALNSLAALPVAVPVAVPQA